MMSKQSANKFLNAAVQDTNLREKFKLAASPEEFIKIAFELGYTFTTETLTAVIKEYSGGSILRRQTGIWPWLRSVKWIEKPIQGKMSFSKRLRVKNELEQALAELCSDNRKLGRILVEKNIISQDKLDQYLGKKHVILGRLLIREKLIFQPELEQALAQQHGSNKKLGEILVEKNIISQNQLERILKIQYWQNNGFWVIS